MIAKISSNRKHKEQHFYRYLERARLKEFWVKLGHGAFLKAYFDGNNLTLKRTALNYDLNLDGEEKSLTRALAIKTIDNGYSFLMNTSKQKDGGVFFGCGDGGSSYPLKAYQLTSTQVVTEIDNGSYEEQIKRYQWLIDTSGLNPYLILSGSKSVHGHILLDKHTPMEAVVYLRRLLCIAIDGDPAVTRPHQPFRLPTFYRREKGRYQDIIREGGTHTYDEVLTGLRACFDALGYRFPESISDLWFSKITSILGSDTQNKARKADPITKDEKLLNLKLTLEQGLDGFVKDTKRKNKERVRKAEIYQFNPIGEGVINDTEKLTLIKELLSHIPQRIPQSGTYGDYRGIFTAVKNELGLNIALKLAYEHSPDTNWQQILKSSTGAYSIGTIYFYAMEWGGYTPPQKNKDNGKTKDQWKEFFKQKTIDYYHDLKPSYTPDITENERYCTPFMFNLNTQNTHGLFGTKGECGTGKSCLIGGQKDSFIERYKRLDFDVISLSPRVALAEEQADRWWLTFINNKKDKQKSAVNDPHINLCADSLHYLTLREDKRPILLVIDEVKSLIEHLLLSSTLQNEQYKILREFERLIVSIKKNNGAILLSDADLNDSHFEFFNGILSKYNLDPLPTFKYENKFKYPDRNLFVIDSENELLNTIDKLLTDNKKIAFSIDSKADLKANIKTFGIKYPDKKLIPITSETIADPDDSYYRDYVIKPTETVLIERPDMLAYTNSMGVGVSIDDGYRGDIDPFFDVVVVWATGTLNIDGIKQSIWRYRRGCDVIIYCADTSHRYTDEIPTNYDETLKKIVKLNVMDTNNIIKNLAQESSDDEDLLEKLKGLITAPQRDIYQRTTAMIKTMNNIEFKYYKELLIDNLVNNGFKLMTEPYYPTDCDGEIRGEMIAHKKDEKERIATKTATAEVIPIETARALNGTKALSADDRIKVNKAILHHQFKDLSNDPLFCYLAIHNAQAMRNIKFLFELVNPEIAKHNHDKKIENKLFGIKNGTINLGVTSNRMYKLKLLKSLGIDAIVDRFLSGESNITITPKEISQVRRKALRNKGKIKDLYNYNVSPKTDGVKFLKWLLKKYSLKLNNDGELTFVNFKGFDISGLIGHFAPLCCNELMARFKENKEQNVTKNDQKNCEKWLHSKNESHIPQRSQPTAVENDAYNNKNKKVNEQTNLTEGAVNDNGERTLTAPVVGSTVHYQRYYPMNNQRCRATAVVKAIQAIGNEITYYLDNFMSITTENIISVVRVT